MKLYKYRKIYPYYMFKYELLKFMFLRGTTYNEENDRFRVLETHLLF